MLITDDCMAYLERVAKGVIHLFNKNYIEYHPDTGYVLIDQTPAIRAELLGFTHIVASETYNKVALTKHGESILLDDLEAWG